MTFSLLVIVAAAAATASASPDPCYVDKAAMLALPVDKFDQDMNGGWRVLGRKDQCLGAAADLIADYRRAHWGELKPSQLHGNYWHEGQLRAAAGQTQRAIPLLMDGVNPEAPAADFEDYALGTVAFLDHDIAGLKAARDRTAAQPEPDWFKESRAGVKAKYGIDLKWPVNLDELDGLIACFDKPYKEAYGGECRPKPKR